MRVLHVVSYYYPATEWGGPVRCVRLLVRSLRQADIEVAVVSTNARGAKELPCVEATSTEIDFVPVSYHTVIGPARYFFSLTMGRDLLRRLRSYDVVHINGTWGLPPLLAGLLCRFAGVPYILSPHGGLDRWSLSQKRLKKSISLALFQSWVIRGAALLHVTSEREHAALPLRYQKLACALVPNCIDMDEFLGLTTKSVLEERFRILVLGRIHRVKGFDLILEALAYVVQQRLPVMLTVAGPDEGGYYIEVQRTAEELGLANCVEFLGNLDRDGVVEALRKSDILVAPSYQENFGLSVAEAMAAGKPVIVSDRVGLADLIAKADAGVVIPLNSAVLGEEIARLIRNPERRKAMGERGRRAALATFSPLSVAKQMINVYEKALASSEYGGRTTDFPQHGRW